MTVTSATAHLPLLLTTLLLPTVARLWPAIGQTPANTDLERAGPGSNGNIYDEAIAAASGTYLREATRRSS